VTAETNLTWDGFRLGLGVGSVTTAQSMTIGRCCTQTTNSPTLPQNNINIGDCIAPGFTNSCSNNNWNVRIGMKADRNSTQGSHNIIIGGNAHANATSQSYNTIVGSYANLYGCAQNSVIIGAYAGCSAGGSNLSTIVGYRAGHCLPFGTCCSTLLGPYAQGGCTTTYNNIIAIGYCATATAANMTVLGALTTTCTIIRGKIDFRICSLAVLP